MSKIIKSLGIFVIAGFLLLLVAPQSHAQLNCAQLCTQNVCTPGCIGVSPCGDASSCNATGQCVVSNAYCSGRTYSGCNSAHQNYVGSNVSNPTCMTRQWDQVCPNSQTSAEVYFYNQSGAGLTETQARTQAGCPGGCGGADQIINAHMSGCQNIPSPTPTPTPAPALRISGRSYCTDTGARPNENIELALDTGIVRTRTDANGYYLFDVQSPDRFVAVRNVGNVFGNATPTLNQSKASICTFNISQSGNYSTYEFCNLPSNNQSAFDFIFHNCASTPNPVCGNGRVETGEQCDDGNLNNGDGCSNQCRTESTNPVCGNGRLEQGEQCDDGNLNNGDGCSNQCRTETPAPVCGNGRVEVGEQCDDGNRNNGDGCNMYCQRENTNPVCGNGLLEQGEQCDDGNTNNGDGCTNQCRIESQGPVCGNGRMEQGEECDDGNRTNGDGCDSTCRREIGIPGVCGNRTCEASGAFTCDFDLSCVSGGAYSSGECRSVGSVAECTYCGDGVVQSQAGEQCDDRNDNNFDNCSNACTWNISTNTCGNNVCNAGETCDGNIKCIQNGQLEQNECRPANSAGNSACTFCGDGMVQMGEQCDAPGASWCDAQCRFVQTPPQPCQTICCYYPQPTCGGHPGYVYYPDCPYSHTFYTYIYQLTVMGHVGGYTDGNFYPDRELSRGEAAAMVVKTLDIPMNTTCGGFGDVGMDNKFYPYITTLKCNGLVNGYRDGTFRSDERVNRGSVAKMINNGLEYKKVSKYVVPGYGSYGTSPFVDVKAGDVFYREIINVQANGIANGTRDGRYMPDKVITRGEMARMMYGSAVLMK